MKLVMTLLVRDEADVVDAQIAYHLDAGVDFVVATDNRSQDGTTEILERYERDGVLHLIREPGDDLRQSEWVTRMARLAATDFGADWILNADADEFWHPRGGSFEELFAAVPERFGAVRGAWRTFVPRPDDGRFFAERMTARLCTPSFHPHPLSTHFKSAHRARADVRIGRGNHEALAEHLVALRGWYPIEILHFPVRSLEQCRRKYVTQFVALERNAEKGIPGHMAEAYDAYRAGQLDAFYAPLVVDDAHLTAGLEEGTYAIDARLRDALRRLGRGDGDAEPAEAAAAVPPLQEAAVFAGEVSVLGEADLGMTFGERIDELEHRLVRLERGPSRARPAPGRKPAFVSDLGDRLLAFVPTRRAAVVLFVVALGVYWFQALGWPMAKGRDTWDYLVYYLQLFDANPPLSQVQLFRTPLTPLAVGLPMAIGGSALLEVVFGVLFAVGVVAWSATALVFGRVPALASAVLLLVYPACATLYHQASSDAVFATGLALWALVLARTLRWPSTWGFVAIGLGIAILVLIRPANQVLLPAVLVPLLVVAPWRRRLTWVAVCLAAAVLPLAGWAVHNGIRYDDATVARGGRAWVPFLKVWLDDRTVAPENGAQSRRLADLIERHVLTEEPFASLHVPLDAYLGQRLELRDRPADRALRPLPRQGRRLRGDLRLRDRGDQGASADVRQRGVADVFWQFLMQAPIREGIAPRAQTEPAPPPATFTRDGVVLPNPAATVLVDAVPYGFVWCASDYIDSCTLDDPSVVWKDARTQQRYREVVSQVRAWDAELPSRSGQAWVTEILDRITPRFPRPPLWIAVGVVALLWRRPRGLADDPRAVGRRGRRARNPRRLAGRRARVRPSSLPALHRDRARCARG